MISQELFFSCCYVNERHLRLFEALSVFFSDLVKLTHALPRCFRSRRHEATILSMCFNLSRASRADNLVKLRKNFQLRAVSAAERSAALNAHQERNELQGSLPCERGQC
jgi:hypothetical protein